jgi:hypothetical protein
VTGEGSADFADAGQRCAGKGRGNGRGNEGLIGVRSRQQYGLGDAVTISCGGCGEIDRRAAVVEVEAEVVVGKVLGIEGTPSDVATGLGKLYFDTFGEAIVKRLKLKGGGRAIAREVVGVGRRRDTEAPSRMPPA